jgi:2,3-bisphosphoglycerate-dependent phosphoglycerate mutase
MRQDLYVITHCETCYNRLGIFAGRVNSRLTANGHKHAERLAKKLKDKKIDIAFISPLIRTRQTLKHILPYHKETRVIVDERLTERDYGSLSRKNKEKYKREHPDLFPVYHRSYDVSPPGGESIKQVEERVLPFIKEAIELMRKDKINVLIITHGNTVRPIRKYFEHLSDEQMMKLENLRHKIFHYKVG